MSMFAGALPLPGGIADPAVFARQPEIYAYGMVSAGIYSSSTHSYALHAHSIKTLLALYSFSDRCMMICKLISLTSQSSDYDAPTPINCVAVQQY